MTNKYAEGYPGKRYYGGCQFVDEVESLAIARAKELFSADHANVQPHSGTQANMTVYLAVLKPWDDLGMNLAHGGHLSMGSPVNFSGMLYRVIPYGVSERTETLDYLMKSNVWVSGYPPKVHCGLVLVSICEGILMMKDFGDPRRWPKWVLC